MHSKTESIEQLSIPWLLPKLNFDADSQNTRHRQHLLRQASVYRYLHQRFLLASLISINPTISHALLSNPEILYTNFRLQQEETHASLSVTSGIVRYTSTIESTRTSTPAVFFQMGIPRAAKPTPNLELSTQNEPMLYSEQNRSSPLSTDPSGWG